jgi:hypothetical protein
MFNRVPYRCINFAWLRTSGALQSVEVMQQLLLDRRIGGHAEGEPCLRSNEAAGALDDPAPKRVQVFAGRFSSAVREGECAIICSSRPRLLARSTESR